MNTKIEILNQDINGINQNIPRHQCITISKKYRNIEFPEKMLIYKFTHEEFEARIKELEQFNDHLEISVIENIRCIIFYDSKTIYEEDTTPIQKITELTSFTDQKGRAIYTLKDFDKFVSEWHKGGDLRVYLYNGVRMLVFEDEIYQEDKNNNKQDTQYM